MLNKLKYLFLLKFKYLLTFVFILLCFSSSNTQELYTSKKIETDAVITNRCPVYYHYSKNFKNLAQDPDIIFNKAWEVVDIIFYDSSYNGQDWEYWRNRYANKLKTVEDAHLAVRTILASLGDKYSKFLDEKEFSNENSEIASKLCGIGIKIKKNHDGYLSIVATMNDSPAQKSGLRKGDKLYTINNQKAVGLSIEKISELIKGPENTTVNVCVLRHNKKVDFNIKRGQINIPVVKSVKMLNSQIGYIRLYSFLSNNATDEMKIALKKLKNAKSIIFDLRDNPGGLLKNAINISNLFIDSGPIVSTIDRDGSMTTSNCTNRALCGKKLVVLVNHYSASASEITSAALQDHKRATIIGETTFGKALVQGVYHLYDGSGMNITIAKYLTPNGTDINKVGVKPDIQVKLSSKDYKNKFGPWYDYTDEDDFNPNKIQDRQLIKAIKILQNSNKSHKV